MPTFFIRRFRVLLSSCTSFAKASYIYVKVRDRELLRQWDQHTSLDSSSIKPLS
jgi:hypothetical protein